jgi:nucleotide sugar dehydrogenase
MTVKKNKASKPLIGFIGQGYIGKNYADDFERRGYSVVRYSLEKSHNGNKENIKDCDIVFIAVPTPTTPKGFDHSMVSEVLSLVGNGKTVVIKSTIVPGTTRKLQEHFPKIYVMHSPEFLVLKQATEDAARPLRNIIGIPKNTKVFRTRAKIVLNTLPKAQYESICSSEEAELIKYAGNFFLYLRVLFCNIIYEIAQSVGADYGRVRTSLGADPRIGTSHLQVVHDSGHNGARRGRGAGGVCFIKDIAALAKLYDQLVKERHGSRFLRSAIEKNINLLVTSGKDIDLLDGVYGKAIIARHKKER